MTKTIRTFLLCLLLLLPALGHSFDFLADLIVNYSNFSYIHSVSVGFRYVYFGTTNGVTRYDISQKKWGLPMTGIEGLNNNEIYMVKASFNDETIWVRTGSGLYEYTSVFNRWDPIDQIPDEKSTGTHIQPEFNYIPPTGYDYLNTGVLVDRNNNSYQLTDVVDDGWSNLWIGSWGLGALTANNSSYLLRILDFGLLQEDVTAIYSDSGTLWMGGTDIDNGQNSRTGFTSYKWRENSFRFVEKEAGYHSYTGQVNAIAANSKNIFVGTEYGLFVIDKNGGEISDYLSGGSKLPGNDILTLLADDDNLYIGTEYGLGIWDLHSDSTETALRTTLQSYEIYSLDRIDNTVWIGTHHGTFRLNLETNKIGSLTLSDVSGNNEIFDIKHSDDKIWLVVNYDLKSVDRHTADIEQYPEVIKYNDLRAIAVKDTLVAAATSSGLLLLFDGEKDRHYLYTTGDGLISNDIRDVVIDGDYIWIGSDKGLSRFWYKHPSLYY